MIIINYKVAVTKYFTQYTEYRFSSWICWYNQVIHIRFRPPCYGFHFPRMVALVYCVIAGIQGYVLTPAVV